VPDVAHGMRIRRALMNTDPISESALHSISVTRFRLECLIDLFKVNLSRDNKQK
jgi:hypothetical protein